MGALRAAASAWSIESTPNTSSTADNALSGVSCTSSSACTAVGYYFNGSGVAQTLIEAWNGVSWTIAASPSASSTEWNVLSGVSCTSSSACTAVGYYLSSGVAQTLIEAWNGVSWTIASSPNTSTNEDNYLSGVSCTSSSACTAVGSYFNGSIGARQTLVEAWDGVNWTIATSPNTSSTADNELSGVSCTSSSACTAVGSYFIPFIGSPQTLIEAWNGVSWTIATSPNTSSTADNELSGVSCTSSSACTAVGYYFGSSGVYQTLIEAWDGVNWTMAASLNSSRTADNELLGVSCTSSSACTAVGFSRIRSGVVQTLIETWNGVNWRIPASPNTSSTEPNELRGASCISHIRCTAVGDYRNGSGVAQTLGLAT